MLIITKKTWSVLILKLCKDIENIFDNFWQFPKEKLDSKIYYIIKIIDIL